MTHAPQRPQDFDPNPTDPILGGLAALARRHHQLVDEGILARGLPLGADGRLRRDQITVAAERAGFTAETRDMPLASLTPGQLPALLLLADGDACVLTRRQTDGSCEVLPGDASPALVPWSTLASRYSGRLVLLRRRETPIDGDLGQTPPVMAERPPGWRPHLPLILAAIPGDALALALAAVVPALPLNWGGTARSVAIAAALAVMVEALLRLLNRHLLDLAARHLDQALSTRLFRQLLGQSRLGSAGAFAEALRAFEHDRRHLARNGVAVLGEAPLVLAMLAATAWLGRELALLPAGGAALLLMTGMGLHSACERGTRTLARDTASRHGLLVESLSALETLRSLGAESRMLRAWEERSAIAQRAASLAGRTESLLTALPDAAQAAILVAVASWGAQQGTRSGLDAGHLAVGLLLSGRIMHWAGGAMNLLARRGSTAQAVRGLRAITAPAEPRSEPRLGRPELREAALREATYRYPGQTRPAVESLTLSLAAGERLGLTGAPGCGKTTAARLLLGLLRPQSGEAQINSLPAWSDAPELRGLTAYAPQDATLVSGRLADNLALADSRAGAEEMAAALHLAGVPDLLVTVGLEGFVGERGGRLSAGQRQGVALARLLLSDAPLAVLDEPCLGWDDASLARLAGRLDGALKGRGLLLISQRAPLLRLAPRCLVLEAGRLRDAQRARKGAERKEG